MTHVYLRMIRETIHVSISKLLSLSVWATHHLQLFLPELRLLRLVEERKVANMMDEDVSKDWEFGIKGRDLAVLGTKWRTESL